MNNKTIKRSLEYQSMTSKTTSLLKNGCQALAMVFEGSQDVSNMETYVTFLGDTINTVFTDIEKSRAPKSDYKKLNEIPFVFVFLPDGSVYHHVVVCHLPKELDGVTTPGEMLKRCYINSDTNILLNNGTYCIAINKEPYNDYFKDADVIQTRAHIWFKNLKLFPEAEDDDEPMISFDDLK